MHQVGGVWWHFYIPFKFNRFFREPRKTLNHKSPNWYCCDHNINHFLTVGVTFTFHYLKSPLVAAVRSTAIAEMVSLDTCGNWEASPNRDITGVKGTVELDHWVWKATNGATNGQYTPPYCAKTLFYIPNTYRHAMTIGRSAAKQCCKHICGVCLSGTFRASTCRQ